MVLYAAFTVTVTTLALVSTSAVKKCGVREVEQGVGIRECLQISSNVGAKSKVFWTFLILSLLSSVCLAGREALQALSNWKR